MNASLCALVPEIPYATEAVITLWVKKRFATEPEKEKTPTLWYTLQSGPRITSPRGYAAFNSRIDPHAHKLTRFFLRMRVQLEREKVFLELPRLLFTGHGTLAQTKDGVAPPDASLNYAKAASSGARWPLSASQPSLPVAITAHESPAAARQDAGPMPFRTDFSDKCRQPDDPSYDLSPTPLTRTRSPDHPMGMLLLAARSELHRRQAPSCGYLTRPEE
ncbi:hypothetical protein HPB47_008104 [Ixodes persulcatus]|uniref:Uncharacterized protein n=1 Tax=Ixodes persulcatus TaxID=34615 RepID=A0AC60P5K3_IXOPE|nr:hypothetical protein HPB47_008104 [Ixodes persulcatus]